MNATITIYEREGCHYLKTERDRREFVNEKIVPSLRNIPPELEVVFDGNNLYFVWAENRGSTIAIKSHLFSEENFKSDGGLSFDTLMSELNTRREAIAKKELPEIYQRYR